MSAKKKPSRHLPPTAQVLAERADRKLNVISKTLKTMLPHWERLIREKEILHGQVETLVVENAVLRKSQCKCPPTDANAFISKPLAHPYGDSPIPILTDTTGSIAAPSAPAVLWGNVS
jgi:hypothetical protein